MSHQDSHMRREVEEISAAVERLLSDGAADIAAAAAAFKAADPDFLITVARGSSDHACAYLKYAAELVLGLPVASVGPSIASIYGKSLRVTRAGTIAISQSGKSPDIVALTASATEGGSVSLAITNDLTSPLAACATKALSIHAGNELSVAATKTFVTSAVAGIAVLAHWAEDAELIAALNALPGQLAQAVAMDWSPLAATVAKANNVYTLGRGPSLAISNEAALKFKEVCQIHAESYSAAEVLHGPVSIVGPGFPVLALASGDAAEAGLVDVADEIAAKGAAVFVTSDRAKSATVLPHVRTGHPLLDPLSLIVSFYAMVEGMAVSAGLNPDMPRHLNKVTKTT